MKADVCRAGQNYVSLSRKGRPALHVASLHKWGKKFTFFEELIGTYSFLIEKTKNKGKVLIAYLLSSRVAACARLSRSTVLRLKFSKLRGHTIKYFLTEFVRAGREYLALGLKVLSGSCLTNIMDD